MTILTQKMLTARKDYAGESLKRFFPFNDGAGTTIQEAVTGGTITPDAVSWTVAHAAEDISAQAKALSEGGSIVVSAGKSIIFGATVITPTGGAAFAQLAFGGASGQVSLTASAVINTDRDTQVTASFASATAGQTNFRLMTFNGVSGVLSAYSGNNGGAVAKDNTADASVHLGEITLNNSWTIGNATFPPDFYAGFLYVVDELPTDSEILTASDWMYAEHVKGHKVLYPDWQDLSA